MAWLCDFPWIVDSKFISSRSYAFDSQIPK